MTRFARVNVMVNLLVTRRRRHQTRQQQQQAEAKRWIEKKLHKKCFANATPLPRHLTFFPLLTLTLKNNNVMRQEQQRKTKCSSSTSNTKCNAEQQQQRKKNIASIHCSLATRADLMYTPRASLCIKCSARLSTNIDFCCMQLFPHETLLLNFSELLCSSLIFLFYSLLSSCFPSSSWMNCEFVAHHKKLHLFARRLLLTPLQKRDYYVAASEREKSSSSGKKGRRCTVWSNDVVVDGKCDVGSLVSLCVCLTQRKMFALRTNVQHPNRSIPSILIHIHHPALFLFLMLRFFFGFFLPLLTAWCACAAVSTFYVEI